MRLSDAPVRRPVSDVQVLAFDAQGTRRRPDQLVTEEPMEVRVAGPGQEPAPFAVAMRTPGNDFELAAGLCLTEGLLAGPDDLEGIAYCLGPDHEQQLSLRVQHGGFQGDEDASFHLENRLSHTERNRK